MTANFTGFVQAALQIGLDSILIKPTRGFYGIQKPNGSLLPDIIAQAVIEEQHHDELEITDHPVQQGAMISDHAFKRPAEVTLKLGWSNSPGASSSLVNSLISGAAANNSTVRAAAGLYGLVKGVQGIQSAINSSNIDQIQRIYQQLLELQESRALFVLYTGKRVYTNMVCKSLATETDFKSANSLPITMVCKQVILVNTQTVDQLPKDTQMQPQKTASTIDKGIKSATTVDETGQIVAVGS